MDILRIIKFQLIPKINRKVIGVFILLLLIFMLPIACDQVTPRTKFILAVPQNEYSYIRASEHLKKILDNDGFEIELLFTKNAQDAVELVSTNKADLCLLMNKSISVAEELGQKVTRLRTILPLYRRSMFFYIKKDSVPAVISPGISFRNRTIGIELVNGETQFGLQNMLDRAKVEKNYTFTRDSSCDIAHFWASNYSPIHLQLIAKGWQSISLDENWIKFIEINNPALKPITIPAIPDKKGSKEIRTLYSETLLLASTNLGENAIYKLTKYIYENKTHLMNIDRMYATIDENYDRKDLLFSLHDGADAYLRRDAPTFIERYADTIALFASVLAFAYATVQTIRSRFRKMEKNRVEKYFIEFLIIKENLQLDNGSQIDLYDTLFRKVLTAKTKEKMDIADFHILSRLIQQELVIMRLGR